MTGIVTAEEAGQQFARLLEKVVATQEEVLITKGGTPVARLMPVMPAAPRVPGIDAGRLLVPEDIMSPLPEEETIGRIGQSFDESLAAIRQGFDESGLEEQETLELLSDTPSRVWAERNGTRLDENKTPA